MDHNLDDPLNLESAMGVDFDHSGDAVVSQPDISLDASSHEEGIPMEFEHIEEQPMLMDTENEEIIDFMGEQFTLQEYSVHDDQITGATTTVETNERNLLMSQSDTMLDLQFEQQPMSVPAASDSIQEIQMHPKIISVKAAAPAVRPIASKKESLIFAKAASPRQVAIAPKPPKLVQANIPKLGAKSTFVPGKQFAIAPKPVGKPVTMMGNRPVSLVKKVSLASAMHATAKGNTVLAQIGKQLVMMPAGSSQKITLVSAGASLPTVHLMGSNDPDQARLTANQNTGGSQATKQIMTKVIVQGQPSIEKTNQPAVVTKLQPTGAGASQPRFVTMQQKTRPISIGNNKVLLTPQPKQAINFPKKQIIAIKSPTPKLLPAPALQGKKVVLTANPTQNVILKTTAPSKAGHVTKVGGAGQKTQLHQINVPGKGIQYIRLVTNSTPAPKSPVKPANVPNKTFVLTDSKGNLLQMTAEKLGGGQPPPLVVSQSAINKLTAKPQQKLVRIAPISSKSAQVAMQQARSGQSLLAPRSPALDAQPATLDAQPATLDEVSELLQTRSANAAERPSMPALDEGGQGFALEGDASEQIEECESDSKTSLQALIAETVREETREQSMHEVEIDFQARQSPDHEDSSSTEPEPRSDEHPLIVIPSYLKQDNAPDDLLVHDDSRSMINVEVEPYHAYPSPPSPQGASETDVVSSELGLRPRKACNCTKSQCLKLYCDCFANGEFCNRCNCNNCHNNLENEELRQKAIRGCLDRNPNAFRPKIGKSKTGGPEIIRRHNKGCNCKRSGCLKNYCECYEAKIACTAICKCVGCRNVEETLERARRRDPALPRDIARDTLVRAPPLGQVKQPCSFMTTEVIEAVCQCLIAAAVEGGEDASEPAEQAAPDPVRDVIEEFARCLQDIISASHQAAPLSLLDETQA